MPRIADLVVSVVSGEDGIINVHGPVFKNAAVRVIENSGGRKPGHRPYCVAGDRATRDCQMTKVAVKDDAADLCCVTGDRAIAEGERPGGVANGRIKNSASLAIGDRAAINARV